MKILIHGDDLEKSRELYFNEKNKLKNPILLNGEGISYDLFFQNTENTSLFDSEISIIIENLYTKNKSNSLDFKKIIEFINTSKNLNIIIWEQSQLTKAQVALLKTFQVNEFAYPKKLFVFLDNIRPNNSRYLIKLFHELRQTEASELILFMIIRQFRIFMQLNGDYKNDIDEVKRMAPWQLSKLKNQVNNFNSKDLLMHFNKLFEMETNLKTGKISFSVDTSIDFFLSGL